MTKEQILDICRADDRMDWWATVLFAEIAQYKDSGMPVDVAYAKLVMYKVEEFERLILQGVIQKAQEAAKQPTKLEELEARIKALEDITLLEAK